MAEAKLSAPVGQSPRSSPGAKVVNKKGDIALVQLMLKANGFSTPTDGKMNSGLIKAIGAAERKLAGSKAPEFVVDPGSKLMKAMEPKYKAHIKVLENTRYYRLPGYKNIIVPEKEYREIQKKMLKGMSDICGIHQRTYDYYHSMHIKFLEAGAWEDGFLRAVSVAVSVAAGSVQLPDKGKMRRAEASVKNLRRAIAAKDFRAIDISMIRCEECLDTYYLDLQRYLKALGHSASNVGTALTVTSTAGWMVVGAMAAPMIVTAAGVGATTAAVASGAGIATLKSAANEIGGYSMGTQKSVMNMAYNMAIEGAIGGVTGGLGSKLPDPFKKYLAGELASKTAGKVALLTGKKAEAVIFDYLSHAGASVGVEAVTQAVKLIGASAKKGAPPSKKDFDAATSDIFFNLIASGFLKRLGVFEKKVAVSNRKMLTTKMVPDWFAKNVKKPIPKGTRVKIINSMLSKVDTDLTKRAFDLGLQKMKGDESGDNLAKAASEKMLKDKEARSIVDFAMRDAMRQHKCPIQ